QETAGAKTDVLGLQKRLGQQEVRRWMRFPWRGMMLADPGFLVAELIEPAQHLKVPVVTLFQPDLRRMRGHREISDFHGVSSRSFLKRFLHGASLRAEESTCHGCGG